MNKIKFNFSVAIGLQIHRYGKWLFHLINKGFQIILLLMYFYKSFLVGYTSFFDMLNLHILDTFGNEIKEEISKVDRFSRHFVLAGELIFHPRFNLRFGYNF